MKNAKLYYITNSASKWGLTGRDFKELNQLHAKYADKGLEILMFPSNTFKQEPYNNEKIEKTYRGKLGAKWWISEMIDVNG